MTDANVRDETIMRELKDLFVSDIDETREEQESFSFHEEAVSSWSSGVEAWQFKQVE